MNLDKSKECQHPEQHILAVPSKGDTIHELWVAFKGQGQLKDLDPGDVSFVRWSLLWSLRQQLCKSSRLPVWASIWNVISLFLECIGLGCKMKSLDATKRWWQHAFASLQMCTLINICASLSKLEGLYKCKLDSDFSVLRFNQKILSFSLLQILKFLKSSLTF